MEPTTPPGSPAEPVPLLLYHYLDEYEARAVAEQLAAVPDGSALRVHIHSAGGEVYSGLAIYNQLMALRTRDVAVETRIDGLAASMASVVAMAGSRITMADNAELLVHNPWSAVTGDSATLRGRAQQLDRLKAQLVAIYAGRTGRSAAELAQLMDTERYLSAAEALALGFVDAVVPATLAKGKAAAEGRTPAARYEGYRLPGSTRTPAGPRGAAAARGARVGAPEGATGRAPADPPGSRARMPDTASIEAALHAALHEGRIAEAQLGPLRQLAHADFPAVQAYLASLPRFVAPPPLAPRLQAGTRPAPRDAERAEWSLRDWEKRDPQGLAQLQQHDPLAYRRLYETTYGIPPQSARP